MMNADQNPTLTRLEAQIAWYDRRSRRCQRLYKTLKFSSVAIAAGIPLVTAAEAPPMAPAILGIMIVLIETLQHMNQYHANWLGYRSTCESLKHEKYLYAANAGPYATSADTSALLAERIESLISQEHAKWISTQQSAPRVERR
jgi:hypothetical protein